MNCVSVLAGICTPWNTSLCPLVAVVALESILFVLIRLWWFSQDEF